jgi:hypothetical protein
MALSGRLNNAPARARLPVWVVVVVILTSLAYLALLVMLARTRRPWNDEAMFANPAWNLVQHGYLGSTVMEEDGSGLPNIHRYTYWMFPFYLVVLAGWFKLVGFGLMSLRALTIFWTCVFLCEWWFLLRRWTRDIGVTLLGLALIAFDYNIMVAGSFGRYDIMVAALGFGGYCCYFHWRPKLKTAILSSNACIAACGITHPNGLMFFLGLWALIFYLDRKRLRWSSFAVAIVPYIVGGILWGLYILQSPQSFFVQLRTNSYSRIGLFTPWRSIAGEVHRYLTAFGLAGHSVGHSSIALLKFVPLAAYLIGLAAFFLIRDLRSNCAFRPFLLLFGVHLFYQTFIDGIKFTYYLVLILPFYAAALALVLAYCWRRAPVAKPLIAIFVMGLIGLQAGGVGLRIRLNEYGRMYAPAVEYLKAHAGYRELIMASCDLGFGYGFAPNLDDDIRLGYNTGKVPEYIVVEEIYHDNIDQWGTTQPALHRFIVNRLTREYDVVYDHTGYQIYKRKGEL